MTVGFRTVRPTDERFYWLSASQHKKGFELDYSQIIRNSPLYSDQLPIMLPDYQLLLKTSQNRPKNRSYPAKLAASITEGSMITARVLGVEDLSISFYRGMLDYSQEVRIKINGQPTTKHLVKPDPAALLEDLYERMDRQRPYFNKLTFEVK
ncbi:MAG: hypothetical protein R3B84_13615 [Zavarzinella sp.]